MAKQVKQRPRQRIRQYVKEWRQYRGLTQDQLAERIDKSRGLVAQIESGLTDLTGDTLHALAFALRCEPSDLLRINPLKEGAVVDISDLLRGATPEQQSEALGYVRGLVRK